MQKVATKLHQSLQPMFTLTIGGILVDVPFQPGIDNVGNTLSMQLRVLNHEQLLLNCMIGLGRRGNECVLLRSSALDTHSGQKPKHGPWEEVACFDPKNPPSEETVEKIVNGSVNKAMRDLVAAVPSS